jgi:hypothetical protein
METSSRRENSLFYNYQFWLSYFPFVAAVSGVQRLPDVSSEKLFANP